MTARIEKTVFISYRRTNIPWALAIYQNLISQDNRACLESVSDNLELAFEYLEKASKRERFDPLWAWEDPDLQWIRSDPRFTEIIGAKPE